jgi:hypothetical protein
MRASLVLGDALDNALAETTIGLLNVVRLTPSAVASWAASM